MGFSTQPLGAVTLALLLIYVPCCATEELQRDILQALEGLSEKINSLEFSFNDGSNKLSPKTGAPEQQEATTATVCMDLYLLLLDLTAKFSNMKSSSDNTSNELLAKVDMTHKKEEQSIATVREDLAIISQMLDNMVNSTKSSFSETGNELITSFEMTQKKEEEILMSVSHNLSSLFLEFSAKVNNLEFALANTSDELLMKFDMGRVKDKECWESVGENIASVLEVLSEKVSNLETTFSNKSNDLLAEIKMTQNKEEESSATAQDMASRFLELTSKVDNMDSTIKNAINGLSEKFEMEDFKSTVLSRFSSIESTITAIREEVATLGRKLTNPCPDEWLLNEGSCYYFSTSTAQWDAGRADCQQKGGDYVKITGPSEFEFVNSHVTQNTWIGLNDLTGEGIYRWISDNSLHKLNKAWWHDGEPNDSWRNEDCIHIRENKWNDAPCSNSFLYVCEKAQFV